MITMDFHHISVFPEEAVEGLAVKSDGIYVDCTLGGAGHAVSIASKLSVAGHLIGIDQDELAICNARGKLAAAAPKVTLVHDNFSNLAGILAGLGIEKVDGFLFDLGISSPQIDVAERGFSYIKDAPLDMRMDRRQGLTAAAIVNNYSAEELSRIFFEYGEERWGKRIAEFIVESRDKQPIKTTLELVSLIDKAIPKAVRQKHSGHSAKRIFQALRIAVNDELGILATSIETAVAHLAAHGRIAVITFHSLEDRAVKNTIKDLATGCICPSNVPICICNHKASIKICGKAQKPSREEMDFNPRARSAKLRVAEKI